MNARERVVMGSLLLIVILVSGYGVNSVNKQVKEANRFESWCNDHEGHVINFRDEWVCATITVIRKQADGA